MRSAVCCLRNAIALSLAALISLASSVQAQEMRWSHAKNGDAVYLDYGVAQTDQSRFRAECSANLLPDTASAILAYNTGHLRDGKWIVTEFFIGGERIYQLQGRVFRSKQEGGFSGLELKPGLSENFWKLLVAGGELSYRAKNKKMATLDLAEAKEPVQKFIEACSLIHSRANPLPAPNPTPGQFLNKKP